MFPGSPWQILTLMWVAVPHGVSRGKLRVYTVCSAQFSQLRRCPGSFFNVQNPVEPVLWLLSILAERTLVLST